MTSVRVAVAGASGYTGAELLRLLSQHPQVNLTAVTSEKSAGMTVSSVYPHLQNVIPLTFEALAPEALAERADVLFLALPHTKSMGPVASCMKAGKRVIDLSADFRLKDPQTYETWYQTSHAHPDLIETRCTDCRNCIDRPSHRLAWSPRRAAIPLPQFFNWRHCSRMA